MPESNNEKGSGGAVDSGEGGTETPPPALSRRRYGRRMGDMNVEPQTQIWLVSFTDVMALMLTFFVMLFAMAEPSKEHWENVTAALHNEFNRFYGAVLSRGPVDEINLERLDFDRALDINYLDTLLRASVKENESLKDVRLTAQPGQLVISLPQDLLFAPGEAAVTDEGARALYALGGILSRIRNRMQIVGHTDPQPVRSTGGAAAFRSNWDLSLARAAGVAGLLDSVGYSQDIDVRGSASGRYEDLRGMADERRRLDLARRVDIVLLDHDGRRQKSVFDLISR